MREVSVRLLHLALDLARIARIDESALLEGLVSVAEVDGKRADWIDWDDWMDVIERFERMAGGPEAVARAMRAGVSVAYPDLRALAAVFLRPIPFFKFVMTRLTPTMYPHLKLSEIERIDDHRIRWSQTIPEPYRASEAFHRGTLGMIEVFPHHLGLPDAKLEDVRLTARTLELEIVFPPSPPLTIRGARAVSSASALLAAQLEDVFVQIGDKLRSNDGSPSVADAEKVGTSRDALDWAERLSLSPRQRAVFALLVQGRANKDIASVLHCSERNVEFHVGKILRAAHVSSRAELLVKVLGAR